MNYRDYYWKVRYDPTKDITNFRSDYLHYDVDISNIAPIVKEYFDQATPKPDYPLIEYPNWKSIQPQINKMAEKIIPFVEKEHYGCSLLCDKIYIYRNIHTTKPISSWLYHYDNNPPTVLKIMIYLTDVDESTAPLETIPSMVCSPSRQGPDHWKTAPNNSRVTPTDEQIKNKRQYVGKAGTSLLFYPNTVHRATVPEKGKIRDVLIIRVKPTAADLSHNYTKYATSFECSGVCSQEPGG